MILTGTIQKVTDGKGFWVAVPCQETHIIDTRQITSAEVRLDDGRTISHDQRKKIHATIRDIAVFTGHETEELKGILKCEYIARTGAEWFSLSDCSVTTANDFLQFLIEFCVENDFPTADNPIDRAPDISRYLYFCLVNKVCAICGQKAEMHHEDHVGAGRNRKEVMHLGMRAQALCRKHHTECHSTGQHTFNGKYKVFGIRLDSELCGVWKLKGGK